MRIAIPTDSGYVSEHFGRCPEFTIVEIENKKAINKEVIPNPGHMTGFLPKFLKEKGVSYVIVGGAGFRAQQFFDEYGIKLITGIQGEVGNAINQFLKGELKGGKGLCKPGEGKGYGIEKEDSQHRN